VSVIMAEQEEALSIPLGGRIAAAADHERHRLERDLHDGAQQRLVSLAMRLTQLRARVVTDSEAERLLAAAQDELAASMHELRELARGLHPAALTRGGLDAAIEVLAMRAPLPVTVDVAVDPRPSEAIEVAAYYLVSEALTNIAKYARADHAHVSAEVRDDHLVVEITDDGVGGAEPASGSGLRGLADRLATLRGELDVSSPRGGGTTLRATISLSVAAVLPV
jgi:signal transduction histidine kinase